MRSSKYRFFLMHDDVFPLFMLMMMWIRDRETQRGRRWEGGGRVAGMYKKNRADNESCI